MIKAAKSHNHSSRSEYIDNAIKTNSHVITSLFPVLTY